MISQTFRPSGECKPKPPVPRKTLSIPQNSRACCAEAIKKQRLDLHEPSLSSMWNNERGWCLRRGLDSEFAHTCISKLCLPGMSRSENPHIGSFMSASPVAPWGLAHESCPFVFPASAALDAGLLCQSYVESLVAVTLWPSQGLLV
jgi:hypothetical protein